MTTFKESVVFHELAANRVQPRSTAVRIASHDEWVEHSEIATCEPDDGFATARPIPAIGVS